ncbi:hypothetical protein [Nocardioides sp.]|uniref:LpxL/LpxP family acyltransferase n=1 Tax=Nocardioides sp. TaxID=35761 RepID=UPI00286B9A3C|nr:hypothetical protein [Nocardioides sp.]
MADHAGSTRDQQRVSKRPPKASVAMLARSAVPDRLVPAITRARVKRKRASDPAVAKARAEMEFLLGAVKPEDIDRATDAYLERDVLRSELRYHPRLIARQSVSNLEALTRARSTGRGVVLSFLHHGHYEGAMASLAWAGEPVGMLVSDDMLAPDAPTFLRQHIRVGRRNGNWTVPASSGMAGSKAVLERGEVLAVATDVPGRSQLTFLGAERLGSSGAARMAIDTNALVLMLFSRCSPEGILSVELSEPLEPHDFAAPHDLLLHLLTTHEAPVLAWPEGYHQPRLRWGVTVQD